MFYRSDLSVECTVGYYSVGGAATCTKCPAGSKCPKLDGTDIELCEAGTYSQSGQTDCTSCVEG